MLHSKKINEARSPLLPQLGLGADYTYTSGFRDYKNQNSNVTSGSLQLTQTLFDMSKWRALTLQEKKRRAFRMSPIRLTSKR